MFCGWTTFQKYFASLSQHHQLVLTTVACGLGMLHLLLTTIA